MCWFLFVVGFIMAIGGVALAACYNDIEIKGYRFDNETIGWTITWIGVALAFLMLLANGIVWLSTLG